MYQRLFIFIGVLALAAFSYAQYRGWNPFQDQVSYRSGHGGAGSGRIYHK